MEEKKNWWHTSQIEVLEMKNTVLTNHLLKWQRLNSRVMHS